MLTLEDGRLLFTFTQRPSVPPDKPPPGLRAALEEQTPDGFGSTVQLDDGALVSGYSYRTADDQLHCEVVRWKLPATQ